MKTETVLSIPELAQDFNNSPLCIRKDEDVFLFYGFDDENGKTLWKAIRFKNTVSFREKKLPFCVAYEIDAYNKVVVVKESPWIEELGKNQKDIQGAEQDYFKDFSQRFKHYLVFFEEYGVFEFVAEEVSFSLERIESILSV